MGQVPPKGFLPSAPYGSSQAINAINPVQAGAQNPQTPLLPPNFQDPGTMQKPSITPVSAGASLNQANGPNWKQMFGGIFTLILLSLALCSPASATTTVTGKMQTLGAGNISTGAFMRFWLRGCAGNQPRVAGSGLIGPSQGGVFFFDIAADSGGNVSGTLYSTRDNAGTGNGQIECGGSLTAVWYGMQAFSAGKGGPEVPVHAKNGASLDISNVTPITTNPVIVSPTGDSTYARIDGGNTPFTGQVSFNSNVLATAGQNSFSTYNINSVKYIDGLKYSTSDICVGLAAAYADLPSTGGKIIAPTGAYNCATATSFNTANKPVIIEGAGAGASGYGTKITWTGSTSGTTMFTFDYGPGVTALNPRGAGLRDISIIGPGSGTVTALLLGGANGAEGFRCDSCEIGGFNTDILWGSNTWGTVFRNSFIRDAASKLLSIPNTITNSGESISFESTAFFQTGSSPFANAIVINFSGVDAHFSNCSIDEAQVVVQSGVANFTNQHMEWLTAHAAAGFITTGGWIKLTNFTFSNDVGGTTAPSVVSISSGGSMIIQGINAASVGYTFPAFAALSGGGNFNLTAVIALSSTAPVSLSTFTGSYIVNGAVGTNQPQLLECAGTTDCVSGIKNDNGGQEWRLDSLSDGSLSLFAVTNATKQETHANPVALSGGLNSFLNKTGLQAFNTTTTCTTGAAVGAICTTAAITLPAAYADTNYRVSAIGLGPTNVPVVQTVTKSNTTFTITIAALSAAAATFTSFDVTVTHN